MKFAAVASLLLLCCSAAQAVDLASFLSDPKYTPFLLKASATGVCLTDPAVTDGVTFDLDLCPSLLKMLEAVNQGATDYPVECEPECAGTFYSLTDECLAALTEEFKLDSAPIGVLGTRFLAECAVVNSDRDGAGAASPSPAPAPAPAMDM